MKVSAEQQRKLTQAYEKRNLQGFESDEIAAHRVKQLIKDFNIDFALELGTFLGGTARRLALKGKSGVLKTFDGVQKYIVTLPIMTQDYYQKQGYFYDPDTAHMFCDTIMTHKADLQKKLIIRNDIVFHHNHYSTKGGQQKDEVNKKADLTWAQGEKVYLDRCRNKFGLGNVNIYDLSPEASKAGHVNWLKKKLR